MEQYSYGPLDLGRPAIRLLRLHRGSNNSEISCSLFQAELHQRHDTTSYEALSYTWGSADLTESIVIDCFFMNITLNLHGILQQLRYQDEDRILWIDAICIDQENKKERGHQVEQMSEIYKEAHRVVFWLGPGNFETDVLMESLQLLQREIEKHNYRSWLPEDDDWKKVWTPMEPLFRRSHTHYKTLQRRGLRELLARPWFRRVWILQEVALARAGIIFCGTKSVSTRLFSLAPQLLEAETDPHCQAVLDIMPNPWREKSWWSKSPDLRTLLLNFGDSKATEPRDLVYALRGMSSDVRERNNIFPDYEKSEESLVREVVQFIEHCEPEDLATPPRTVRDLIQCLKVLDTDRCVALAKNSSSQDMEMLLLKRPEVKINQEIIAAAVAWDKNGEVVEMLLQHRPKEFTVSDEVLVAAARNPRGANKVFQILSHHLKGRFKISEDVVIAAAENQQCGSTVLNLLLTSDHCTSEMIKEEVLIAIATNKISGDRAMGIIHSYRSDLSDSLIEALGAIRRKKPYDRKTTGECLSSRYYADRELFYRRRLDSDRDVSVTEERKIFTAMSKRYGGWMLYISLSYNLV